MGMFYEPSGQGDVTRTEVGMGGWVGGWGAGKRCPGRYFCTNHFLWPV
jgi:hypothetical protein